MVRRAVVPFVVGVSVGVAAVVAVRSDAQAPPTYKPEDPAYRGLDSNLYMQTAAEYRACCLQAYNLGAARLAAKHAAWKANPGPKPPAVVFDLDETVFDNAGFQAMQVRSRLAYDQRLWDRWEQDGAGRVLLVPGADTFLAKVRELKVAEVYISNRDQRHREGTKKALARHGIGVPENQLLLATDTSDKTRRRAEAAAAFDVLLYFGDNLRDFDERFKYDPGKGIPGRKAEVDATAKRFGDDWIILPNPAYGEWTKPLGKGAADADQLVPVTPGP